MSDEEEQKGLISQIDETLEQDSGWGFPNSRIGRIMDYISFNIFGPLFYGKKQKYQLFSKKLNQARIPVSYDVYLSRVVFYSFLSAIVGLLFGILIATSVTSFLASIELQINLPSPIKGFVEAYELMFIYFFVILTITIITFTVVTGLFYYYPFYLANERKRRIDSSLPHAITFAYAMSRGGANILDVIKALADAEDTYGEVSKEFSAIVQNVEFTQTDLRTAVADEALQTPSDNLQDFLEDFLNVIDTGSDVESFLLNKADLYMEDYRKQQENLLETLEILSEAYVTVFVASPIFILVVLVVMTMMGGDYVMELSALTYLGIPAGGFLFAMMIKVISSSPEQGNNSIRYDDPYMKDLQDDINIEKLSKNKKYHKSKIYKKQREIKSKIKRFIPFLVSNPLYSFLLTIPFSILYIYLLYSYQIIQFTVDAFIDNPISNTLFGAFIPILIVFGIYSILFEVKYRRRRKIMNRLPEVFKAASNANSRGLTIDESFKTVSENSQGFLAEELNKAMNQNDWTNNINKALVDFSNNLKVPRLTRTMKLIVKSNQVTGNIQPVLKVASQDVENMQELDKQRYSNGVIYLMVIIISFLVCMAVIVMIDSVFLSEVAGNEKFQESSEFGFGGSVPVETFRLLFLHMTMILAGSSGVVAGTMSKNSISSGLKISLGLMVLPLIIFALF